MPSPTRSRPTTRRVPRSAAPSPRCTLWSIRDLQGSHIVEPIVWKVRFSGPIVPYVSGERFLWPKGLEARKGVYDWLHPADLTLWLNRLPLMVVTPEEEHLRVSLLSPGKNGWSDSWRKVGVEVPPYKSVVFDPDLPARGEAVYEVRTRVTLAVPHRDKAEHILVPYGSKMVLGSGEDDGAIPEVTITACEPPAADEVDLFADLRTKELSVDRVVAMASVPDACRAMAENLTLPEDGFRLLRDCFDTATVEALVKNPSLPDAYYPWAARFLPRAFAQNPALPLYTLNDPELRGLGLPVHNPIYRHLRYGEPLKE